MKLTRRIIFILFILPLVILGCSEEEEPAVPGLEQNIVGAWTSTDVTADRAETWQFLPDGTFVDTQGASFQYEILETDGIYYIAFNMEDLNIELEDELREELEGLFDTSDFVPIYHVRMPSESSLIIEPAIDLYGSDTYFGATFQMYVLRRQ